VRNTARTAGAVLAAAAGMMMLGTPALAAQQDRDDPNVHHNHAYNGVNTLNETNVTTVTGACEAAHVVAAPINAVAGAQIIPAEETVGNCASSGLNE
jgi:hypothetical protein